MLIRRGVSFSAFLVAAANKNASAVVATTMTTTPTLTTPQRNLGFRIFVDKDNPDATLLYAREVKSKEEMEGRPNSTRYLHALVNVAVAHYHRKDFALARRCALFAHTTIVRERGSRHTLVYFSATTSAKCCRALGAELSGVLERRGEFSNKAAAAGAGASSSASLDDSVSNSTLLMQEGVKSFGSIQGFVGFLDQEARRYESIAKRIISAPDKFFMRSDAEHRAAASQETGQSNTDFEAADAAAASSASSTVGAGAGAASSGDDDGSGVETTSTSFGGNYATTINMNVDENGTKSGARRKRTFEDELRRSRMAEAAQHYRSTWREAGRPNSYQPRSAKMWTRSKGRPITKTLSVQR